MRNAASNEPNAASMPSTAEILTVPLPDGGLSANQYKRLQETLANWEEQVRRNTERFPRESYDLGRSQIDAFLQMTGQLGDTMAPGLVGPHGPTKRGAVAWQKRYTLHEIDGALTKYLDEIKSNVLYGLRGGENPVTVAARLYKATRDAKVNWRTIARTEMTRANAEGRYDQMLAQGYEECWFPAHTGACKSCRRLLEGKVFRIADLQGKTNYGRPVEAWIACCPCHPNCRHVPLPYVPAVFEQAQREYQSLKDNGLDDKTLNDMFDSSGQLKPQYENDPRLAAYFDTVDHVKTLDPLEYALGNAIEKTRREEPPGLHHTSARRCCQTCEFYDRPECSRYNWPVDPGEVCRSYTPQQQVGKGYFDNPQAGLDPLLWTSSEELRPEVRDRIVQWWRHTYGASAPLWSSLYITGSSTGRAWEGRKTPGDVDVQVVVDWAALRRHHPEYSVLPDPDLHAALVTQAKATSDGLEAAAGLPMEAFVRPEHTVGAFERDVHHKGQGVWDIKQHRWLVKPPAEPVGEDYADDLEGEGGLLAGHHPDWVQYARNVVRGLEHDMQDPAKNRATLQIAYNLLHAGREHAFGPGGKGTRDFGNFVWRYCMDLGPLAQVKHYLNATPLEKIWPGYTLTDDQVAKTDVPQAGEHWITIHPGGDEKGIPVLIRENGDGTATVIGGAGGHLNHLRIQATRRIRPQKRRQSTQDAWGPSTDEERQAREDQVNKAEDLKASAQQEHHAVQQNILDTARKIVDAQGIQVEGERIGWDDLSPADQRRLLKNVKDDSLYQSTYGRAHDMRRAEAPSGPIRIGPEPSELKDTPSVEAPPGEGDEQVANAAPDGTTDSPDAKSSQPRLRVQMGADDADLMQELMAQASHAHRRVRDANRVINADKPQDTADLEWQPLHDPADAARKRAARAAETQLNRDLYNHLDQRAEEGKSDSLYRRRVRAATLSSFNSVGEQLIDGTTRLTGPMMERLGVDGAAKIIAYGLQRQAHAGQYDLDTVTKAIDEITDERQRQTVDVDLQRAIFAQKEIERLSAEEKKIRAGGASQLTISNIMRQRLERGQEASQALAMAASGSEALHHLRTIVHQPVTQLEVPHVTRNSALTTARELGVRDPQVHKEGPGRYVLTVRAGDMDRLLKAHPQADQDLRDDLEKIRTGQDLQNEIQRAQNPPGMAGSLYPVQAKGSLFLQRAKSGILAFAPGVGKTRTTIAAALEEMAKNPNHKVLIVCPTTAIHGTWESEIQKLAPGKTVQCFDKGNRKKMIAQGGADFNIVGTDTLAASRGTNWAEEFKKLGHTIMVVDELQYAKNAKSGRYDALNTAAEGVEHRWGLTGTPAEKNLKELHAVTEWARPGEQGSVKAYTDRYGDVNQYQHLSGEEQVQQFRDGAGAGLFYASHDASSYAAQPELQRVPTPLEEGHRKVLEDIASESSQDWLAWQNDKENNKKPNALITRGNQARALINPAPHGYVGRNARAEKVADLIQGVKDVEYNGANNLEGVDDGADAGTYAGKSIVFNRETQPLGAVKDAIEKRGTHKVFYTDGTVDDNDGVLRQFMAHPGPAVLLTSDKNKTARSLQFGYNNGVFQHGATRVIHTDLPQNNADLAQRVARAARNGAQAPVDQFILDSGTEIEKRAFSQMEKEQATLNALGNREQDVHGKETLGQKVRRMTRRKRGSDE